MILLKRMVGDIEQRATKAKAAGLLLCFPLNYFLKGMVAKSTCGYIHVESKEDIGTELIITLTDN